MLIKYIKKKFGEYFGNDINPLTQTLTFTLI